MSKNFDSPIEIEFCGAWPHCPNCGLDELYSLAIPPTVETIEGCYACGFKVADRRDKEKESSEKEN